MKDLTRRQRSILLTALERMRQTSNDGIGEHEREELESLLRRESVDLGQNITASWESPVFCIDSYGEEGSICMDKVQVRKLWSFIGNLTLD